MHGMGCNTAAGTCPAHLRKGIMMIMKTMMMVMMKMMKIMMGMMIGQW